MTVRLGANAQELFAICPEACARYAARVAEFKAAHPDWDTAVNQYLPMHTAVQVEIVHRVNGPAIAYLLGKRPDYALYLSEVDPTTACIAIAELDKSLARGNSCSEPTPAAN